MRCDRYGFVLEATELHETVDGSKKVRKLRFVTWQRWLELEPDALKVHYASTDKFAAQK